MNRSAATIPQSVIKEIVKEIAKGNTCYLDRYTAKISIIDHSIEDAKSINAQEIIKEKIEKKIEKYVKIERLSDKYQLMIMKDFLEEITDKSIRKELSNALKRKSPIRNFYKEVESDMGLNQHWVNFNSKESQRWVTNFLIDAYNY